VAVGVCCRCHRPYLVGDSSQPRALLGVNSLDNLPRLDYEFYRFNVKSLI
jgi:hypothetical protein